MVIEPPCGALLDASGNARALEAADDGADGGVVIGVQGIDNGLGNFVGAA